jgi:2-polyprenyl-3-methyl-5-hydroxy-6-metoxy-1,4-benzoquinol methylase
MYVDDDAIIRLSKTETEFAHFIITPEALDIRLGVGRAPRRPLLTGHTTLLFAGFGWTFLCSGMLLLTLFTMGIVTEVPLSLACALVFAGFALFTADYSSYRSRARAKYWSDLTSLRELSNEGRLSEYDIRTSARDVEEGYGGDFGRQRDFVHAKSEIVRAFLEKHTVLGKRVLHVGCGGRLHAPVSKPYVENGYELVGVDVSEDYLGEFQCVLGADAVQANAMCLPLASCSFDVVNFTDIVEHLHNPLLGLREAHRILKPNGLIILSTNNRCTMSRACMNPLIFFEKVVGAYYGRILPPRNLIGQWMDFDFYHTEFSKSEITELMETAGFELLRIETGSTSKHWLLRTLGRMPILRYVCGEFLIIAKNTSVSSV